ncbi:MAG: phosphoglycerate mutase [Paenibacillus sp.]|nr:phosphoglycerate mutase [Paenibacillus sp.]
METIIYMVRHAESPFVFGEEKTRGLSEEGFADAVRAADLLDDVQVDYMASSSYTRAVQTIQSIADRKGIPIEEWEQLIERPIKGLNYKTTWEVLHEAIRESFSDPDYALEGGESTRTAQQRAVPVIEQLLSDHRGGTLVIGTHGNIMTIILNHYDKSYGYEFWMSTSKPDIYKLTFNEENQLLDVQRVWQVKE